MWPYLAGGLGFSAVRAKKWETREASRSSLRSMENWIAAQRLLGELKWRKAEFVANFVVQLDNFWTAERYFNKLYFITVFVKVFLILVFSFCRLNMCCLILSLAQTQNLKLISFFCRSHAAGLNQVKTWN